MDKYYQSKENGNLLTYDEMIKEAAELYDVGDPTNSLSWQDYYTKTSISVDNPYNETNFRIEPTNNNTFLVHSDSERFGKDAIVYESHDRDDCVDYISVRRPPMKDVGAYIIPDIKSMVDSNIPSEPIEHYKTVDEAIQRFNELYSARDYSDDTTNPNSGLPYARLVIGIEDAEQQRPVDVIHIMQDNKVLIDDFTRRYDINTDRACLDAIEQVVKGVEGVSYVLDFSKDRNSPSFEVASEWKNPYFDPKEIYVKDADVKYLTEKAKPTDMER